MRGQHCFQRTSYAERVCLFVCPLTPRPPGLSQPNLAHSIVALRIDKAFRQRLDFQTRLPQTIPKVDHSEPTWNLSLICTL